MLSPYRLILIMQKFVFGRLCHAKPTMADLVESPLLRFMMCFPKLFQVPLA